MARYARIAWWTAISASVLPSLAVAILVARHARNVPYKDQWGLVPFMVDASRGALDPSALWMQVNEHRLPLTLLLQGGLAWLTRWDVRYEAWVNVVAAALTFLALVGLVRRTLYPTAPAAAATTVVAGALLTFSLAGGINWPWGSLNATYLAALAAAVLAWRLAGWDGRWPQTVVLVACASAGAFAFGAGVVLVLLLPAALLACPSIDFDRRVQHATVAVTAAVVVISLYFVGWAPRADEPPPVVHWNRLHEYARYVLVYGGASLGPTDPDVALLTGMVLATALVASSVWLWIAHAALHRMLVPWWLLAAYSLANGTVTAFGRLDTGAFTALFVRYLPTASFLTLSTVALATLATTMLRRHARAPAAVAFTACALAVAAAAPGFYTASLQGAENMRRLARMLDAGARCLPDCATASDECLLQMCWRADVARHMCPRLAAARIGPFAP